MFKIDKMKKTLGIAIIVIGALILLGAVVLTPAVSFNPADSNNGTHAAALYFFGGLFIAGVGIVIFANSLPNYKEKNT
jgi:flagellar basal body-associated protein FliL